METFTATKNPNLRFDPFAEAGDEFYDPSVVQQIINERYKNNEVHHDYTADQFIKDTEANMLTAHFNDQFEAMQEILQQVEQLCNHDHELAEQFKDSEVLSSYSRSDNHDGHNHVHGKSHGKKSEKEKTKKKDKKKTKLSMYEIMMHAREYRQKLFKKK
jgi:hypothetical protein